MQAFKLVNAGFVDKVVIFDTLPNHLISGVRTRSVDGFPRSWARFLGEIGSTRIVNQTTTVKRGPGDYEFTHTPVGKEACFYVLDYMDINADKEYWRSISEYLRMNCGPEIRLKEKVEDMALSLAPNASAALAVEPEDIPVIAIRINAQVIPVKQNDVVGQGETIIVEETPPKRRGRPKKVAVEA